MKSEATAAAMPYQDVTHEERIAHSAGATAISTVLSAMNGAGARRAARVRDLSHVQRERDEAAAALAAMAKTRPLKPPPLPAERLVSPSAGHFVLQQEIRRGISKRRLTQLWESGVSNGYS